MGNKLTIEFIKEEFVRLKGYELLEDEYINANKPMKYKCPNHMNEDLQISYGNLKCGHGCRFCLNDKRQLNYIQKIKIKNVLMLDKYININTKIKHKCLICEYEFYDSPHRISKKEWKCDSCFPNRATVVVGKNDIWTTNIELARLLANPEDGYKYSYGSHKKINWKCPSCGNIIENKSVKQINSYGLPCPICSDGISYPQKIMANVLKELNIEFDTEQSFDWCTFELNNKKHQGRYDFVFNYSNQNYIIETDGKFHNSPHKKGKISLDESKFIDSEKDRLAKKNNYKIIRIDCLKSELEYIKHNIINSELSVLYDLSNINWDLCHSNSLKSKVIEACNLWNMGIKSTPKIAEMIKISRNAAIGYLKKCSEINLCDYNPKQEIINNAKNRGKLLERGVVCKNTKQIFDSVKKANKFYKIRGAGECAHKKYNYSGIHPVTNEKLVWEFYNPEVHTEQNGYNFCQ